MPTRKLKSLDSDEDVVIFAYIDATNEASLKVVASIEENDKYDAIEKEDALPEHIVRVKSTWRRPTFGLSQLIEINQYIDKVNPQTMRIERVFDYNALTIARIRVLLKSWNLCDLLADEKKAAKYKITFEKAMENSQYTVLSADSMTRVLNVYPPELVTNLYNKMLIKMFPDDAYVRALEMQREMLKAEKAKEEEEAKNLVGEPAKA
jgi:hypothetical protein